MHQPRVEVVETEVISDRQLLRSARAGDRRAFGELARSRVPGVYRLAAAVLGSDADAADATQNALVAAWRELPRVRDIDQFDPWLRRIVVGECRMQLRQGRNRSLPSDPDGAGALVTSSPTPARDEALNLLERAFEGMDPDDRVLVALHILEQRSVAEMADALRMPATTAKVRLHEAREALHRAMGSG